LIRAGDPLEGIETMLTRRRKKNKKSLLAGPGSLAQALGITTALTGISLSDDQIWIENQQISIDNNDLQIGPRVGVDYAGEDALRPYRFRVEI
jgi:DNA-3-methyladenine glycosylase